MYGTVFDVEGNGLDPTKLYVVAATDSDDEEPRSTSDYDKMRQFFLNTPILVGHNIARWDAPAVEKVLEIEIPKETLIVDTLALSWYLSPDRDDHKLATYGEEFGIPKPEIDDWENLSVEEYTHRCVEDVKINRILWDRQYKYLKRLYGSQDDVERFLRYLAFKMDCARAQEESRWRLDRDRAKASFDKLELLRQEKTDELRTIMPKVPVVKLRNPPAKPNKANGELSEAGRKWQQLVVSRGLPEDHNQPVEVITGYDEPNPGSHQQIKDWLYGLGWVPETFKTNKKGKEIPQINKSKQDGGGICESITKLYEIEPRLEVLDRVFVLGHRLGILSGFLRDCSEDGYLVARVAGLTNTLRFKHAEIVNLPKIDTPFGDDIRGCLIAPEGYELCGSDMSSLEDRTKQHYMFKYDPDYVKEMMTPDFDPHLDIAVFGGLMDKVDADWFKKFKPAIASTEEHHRYKLLKTVRGIAKNTNYAGVYGAGAPKIAKTAGITLEKAQELHTAYWKRNWSVKAVAAACKTKKLDGVTWLFNPVSRFWYYLRKEKDRFSTLNQSTGVFCFDTWLGYVRAERPQLTGQFHDEIILCVKKGYREEVEAFLKACISKTNALLKLNRELDIGVEFGDNYGAIH